ncbi:MAG: CRISPR-associated endonuclease Cas2 [Desulfuromonadaceae bacterium]|nr:CRISPR-associated endonuclease Cas2 [Desulfuromonadaceae bacterium]
MMVLITYDVETISEGGTKRLRHVAKACKDYGQRVQNSVFECVIDPALFVKLKDRLLGIIDNERDSLRFYYFGSTWSHKVEHYGVKASINFENDSLIV